MSAGFEKQPDSECVADPVQGISPVVRSVSSGPVSEVMARWFSRVPPSAFKLRGGGPQFDGGDTSTTCTEDSGSDTAESEPSGLGTSPVAPGFAEGFEALGGVQGELGEASFPDFVWDRLGRQVELDDNDLGESGCGCSLVSSTTLRTAPVRRVPAVAAEEADLGIGARDNSPTPSLRFGSKLVPGTRQAPRSSRASWPFA